MISKLRLMLVLGSVALLLGSCTSRKLYTTHYYFQHQQSLAAIDHSYRELYAKRHFSLEFTDKSFDYISLEIKTDSVKLIYEFEIHEPRLQDTLSKYGLPAEINNLMQEMRKIHCFWINTLDYYVGNKRETMVFMSIRNVAIHLPFTSEKYYILTFYAQPQYYDSEGRLLAGRNLRRLRRINDEVFRRITDKVCYTISARFR